MMSKVNSSTVCQNIHTKASVIRSQPNSVITPSRVNWAKIAKYIAITGGAIVAGYLLFKGCASATKVVAADQPFAANNCASATRILSADQCFAAHSCESATRAANKCFAAAQCFAANKEVIEFSNGKICCVGDPDCKGREGILNTPHGLSYTGEFAEGLPSGTGNLTTSGGLFYTGEFIRGRLLKGIWVTPDGETYQWDYTQSVSKNRENLHATPML
ncbi:MAG TPA: hypothetical protein VLE95_03335 [Chlamydiales bacterium]|nr:hypothetical protein [Chlamydiales bacterium]